MPDGREGIWELRITRHWPNQYSFHNQCIPLRHLKATKKSIEKCTYLAADKHDGITWKLTQAMGSIRRDPLTKHCFWLYQHELRDDYLKALSIEEMQDLRLANRAE
uniref:Uncharacterized protein n=1 Tax=Oryza glumipatula TaxID=40148 RepID=A0A0D9YT62_9ORYZ